jgi:hypothetical protein
MSTIWAVVVATKHEAKREYAGVFVMAGLVPAIYV